jgi:hypothetical protein
MVRRELRLLQCARPCLPEKVVHFTAEICQAQSGIAARPLPDEIGKHLFEPRIFVV